MSKKNSTKILSVITKELQKQDRNILWLSKNTKIPYGTLYGILKQNTVLLKQEHLDKINKVLNCVFVIS
jgi:predicted transcriptional regulator